MVGVVGQVRKNLAPVTPRRLAIGVEATTFGHLSTAAFRAASHTEVGQPGATMFGLRMDEQIVADAAITMPRSLSGAAGTIISSGPKLYSYYDRSGKVVGGFVDGNLALAVGSKTVRLDVNALPSHADDDDATAGGVVVGQVYWNGSALMIWVD